MYFVVEVRSECRRTKGLLAVMKQCSVEAQSADRASESRSKRAGESGESRRCQQLV